MAGRSQGDESGMKALAKIGAPLALVGTGTGEHLDALVEVVADVDVPGRPHRQPVGLVELAVPSAVLAPLRYEGAAAREFLDPVEAHIRHVDESAGVRGDGIRGDELAGAAAKAAPLREEGAIA